MTIELVELTEKLQALAGPMEGCHVLIQGYAASGFGKLGREELTWAPNVSPWASGPFALPWDRFSDLRIFGSNEEYHAWRAAGGLWRGRSRKNDSAEPNLERLYPILGTRTAEKRDGWALRTEERGAEVWVPEEYDRPGRRPALRILQILHQSTRSRLHGVVDAMITGFVSVEEVDQ